MNDLLSRIFISEKTECFAPLPIEKCKVRRPDLLQRAGLPADEAKTAIMFLIPYYINDGEGNISLYARPMDYHAYCDELFRGFAENCAKASAEDLSALRTNPR